MLTQDEIDDWYFGNDASKPVKEPFDRYSEIIKEALNRKDWVVVGTYKKPKRD